MCDGALPKRQKNSSPDKDCRSWSERPGSNRRFRPSENIVAARRKQACFFGFLFSLHAPQKQLTGLFLRRSPLVPNWFGPQEPAAEKAKKTAAPIRTAEAGADVHKGFN